MSDTTTINALRQNGRERLKAHTTHPDRDIDRLLTDLLGVPRAYLFSRGEELLTADQVGTINQSLIRLESGEPMAYVRGEEDFWSLSLSVTPSVLIPRPDTERLVDVALETLSGLPTARILELGTGSGAVALALATERPQDAVVATDISADAIDVATANYQRLIHSDMPIANVSLVLSDWYAQLDEPPFDLIVSNPPYIAPNDPHVETSVRQYEPSLALFASNEGMAAIEHIVAGASTHLKKNGALLLEHGWQQHSTVQGCLSQHGFIAIKSHQDFGGHYRVTEAQRGNTK